jgi:O-antigen/teichoic acid export membrane protein
MAYFFKGIPFKGIKVKVTTLKYNEIFNYSIPLVVASIWGVAIRSADQFYISRFFGTVTFAEFSNGFTELPFVSMITASTSIVLMPIFSKMIHEKTDIGDVFVVWKNVLLKSAYIIYPIVVFFIFNANYVMTILYSSAYEGSKIYFQICMFLNFFNIIIFTPLILALGETKFYLRLHIFIALLAWVLGYFVVIIFNSPIAIAIFSVLLSILKVLLALKFLSSKLKINFSSLFPIKKSIQILLHTCLCMFLSLWLLSFCGIIGNVIFRLVINLTLYVIFVLATATFFKLEYLKFLTPIIIKIKSYVK